MKTNFSFTKITGAVAIMLAFGGVALVACDDSNDNPTPRDAGPTEGGVIVADTGPPKDGPTTGDTLITPRDGSGDTGGDGGGFIGKDGCWVGPTTKSNEALNACTDGTCIPFNNAIRLPLYNNGNVPSVP